MSLKSARIAHGDTQRSLAIAVDSSIQNIQRIEQGHGNPSDKLKVRIANYLGKSVEEIFFADDITNSNKKIKEAVK